MTNFVHLHCHSEYSILECPIRIKEMVAAAKDATMPALALTDNASMYGALEFYQAAKKAGINPLLGVDFYVCSDMTVKERWSSRLVMLAMSFKGYQNIIKMVSKAHLEGVYYKPRIDMTLFAQYAEDVIVISPGGRGPIAGALEKHQDDQAVAWCERLQDICGDRFYLGVQRLGRAHEELVETGTLELAQRFSIPIVAMNDVYTMKSDEAVLRDVLFCIQTGKRLDDHAGEEFDHHEAYFKSPEQMQTQFSDRPEWLAETVKVAQRCKIEIEMEQVLLPRFECPDQKTPEVYLRDLVMEGVEKRYDGVDETLQKRCTLHYRSASTGLLSKRMNSECRQIPRSSALIQDYQTVSRRRWYQPHGLERSHWRAREFDRSTPCSCRERCSYVPGTVAPGSKNTLRAPMRSWRAAERRSRTAHRRSSRHLC